MSYKPLSADAKEIRLLCLAPGPAHSKPCCELEIVSLNLPSLLDYEAVSYTRGNPNDLGDINCDGQPLVLPKSAEMVLRGLRLENKTRTLWIDAICIDQSNREERERQVAIMGDVYRNAKRTLVWLGHGDDGFVDTAYALGQAIGEIRVKTDGFKQLKSMILNESGFLHDSSQFQLRTQIEDLVKLYNRPWFSRLWVVQEVALSNECICICGHHEILWTDVARTAAWLQYVMPQQHGTSRMDCPGIDNATIMWQYSEREYGLHGPGQVLEFGLGNLLANSRHFKASDPRDKVFGLLALTTWSMNGRQLPRELTPDYRKSFVDVYRDATRLALLEKRDLHILRYVLASMEQSLDEIDVFPSWVPRWDKRANPYHARPLPRLFSAAQGRKMTLRIHPDLNCLELLGSLFDHVTNVSDVIADMRPVDEDVAQLLPSLSEFSQFSGNYPTGETLREAITLTVIAGTINKKIAGKTHPHLQVSSLRKEPVTSLIKSEHLKTQYANACVQACLNRRFFITGSGYFGLGPQSMRQNDTISILFGGRTPYVLRQVGLSHIFLGECYVHGIMFGEGMEKQLETEPRYFEIR